MYLMIEDNPNSTGEERVFATSGPVREVTEVLLDRPDGITGWCDLVSVTDANTFGTPVARQVEDSAAGVAWLITGGDWGLRVRPSGANAIWAVDDPSQWGVPFLVMDDSAGVVRFKDGK